MVAGEDLAGDAVGDQRRTDGHARTDGLPDRHQIRVPAERLIVERVSGAAEAALNLVGDEERAGPLGRPCHGGGKRR